MLVNVYFGHKDERRHTHLRCLYSFLVEAELNVPKIIFSEMVQFIEGPTKARSPLPFPTIITRLILSRTTGVHRSYHLHPDEEDDAVVEIIGQGNWTKSVNTMARIRREGHIPPPPPGHQMPPQGEAEGLDQPILMEDWHFGYDDYNTIIDSIRNMRVDMEARSNFYLAQQREMCAESHRHDYDMRQLLHGLTQTPLSPPYTEPHYPHYQGHPDHFPPSDIFMGGDTSG